MDAQFGIGQPVELTQGQTHYLIKVMRRCIGDEVYLFNGKDGEWVATLVEIHKRSCRLRCERLQLSQSRGTDVWLLFAPVRRSNTELIVEKATELGVEKIIPVITERTNPDRSKLDRLVAIATEAAEQCERLDIPVISQATMLNEITKSWPRERSLVFADEKFRNKGADIPEGPIAVLIGPEGGFSAAERRGLGLVERCVPISLGPRILRAETAAVAALTLVQAKREAW